MFIFWIYACCCFIQDNDWCILKDRSCNRDPLTFSTWKRIPRFTSWSIPSLFLSHCCNSHFLKPFTLLPKHCQITNRLGFLAIHQLSNTMNVKGVASSLDISSSTVFRRLQDVKLPKPSSLPLVLSIDKFKGNAGGQKFQVILTDPKQHKIMDIHLSRVFSKYYHCDW